MTAATRHLAAAVLALAAAGAAATSPLRGAQAPAGAQTAVDAAFAKFRTLNEGKNADYIPALARVDPNLAAISTALGGNPYATKPRS